MKKILSLTALLMIALFSFTSCDEDMMVSSSLEGVWRGEMYTYYEYSGRTQKVSKTEISFDRDIRGEYTSGTGYWTDYFYGGDYYRSRIFWEVKNQHIFITFRSDHTTIEIYDYKLNSNHFRGNFKDGVNTYTDFDLIKIADKFDDYGDDYYYYSNSKATRSGDSTTVELPVRKFKKNVNK